MADDRCWIWIAHVIKAREWKIKHLKGRNDDAEDADDDDDIVVTNGHSILAAGQSRLQINFFDGMLDIYGI